jgi:hypothetical protein
MNFFSSPHCKSQILCKICRNKEDKNWRSTIKNIFQGISDVDFECPHGKKWGDVGIEIPEPDYDVYSDGTTFNKLGDSWTFISWLLQQNEETGEIQKVTRNKMFDEIINLLDSNGKIEFVDRKGAKKTNAYWGIKSIPTKITWKPNSSKRICYQYNASVVNRPPRWDIVDFTDKFKDYEFVKLDMNLSLSECVKIASESAAFIGVSSGMSHVMHSVGIPMFLMSYGFDIRPFHGSNEYVLCQCFADCEVELRKYLTDKVYKPEMHLVDPMTPRSVGSCGCNIPKIWGQLKDLSGSIKDIAHFVTEPRVAQTNYDKRKQTCQQCSTVDSHGTRLFRKLNENYYSCGALRSENILRDSQKDGCGCILNMKWIGKSQTCIKGYW